MAELESKQQWQLYLPELVGTYLFGGTQPSALNCFQLHSCNSVSLSLQLVTLRLDIFLKPNNIAFEVLLKANESRIRTFEFSRHKLDCNICMSPQIYEEIKIKEK